MRWACRACGCVYAAGAPCCPQCRATAHDEVQDEAAEHDGEEDEVPKIDRTGLASIGHATYGHSSEILPDGVRISGSTAAPETPATDPPAATEPPAPASGTAKPAPSPAKAPKKAPDGG